MPDIDECRAEGLRLAVELHSRQDFATGGYDGDTAGKILADAAPFATWLESCHCDHLAARLDAIDEQLRRIMAAQDDINAAVAEDNTLLTDLGTQVTAVQAAQTAFEAQISQLSGQGVDTSGLVTANEALAAAQAPLDAAVQALTAASTPPAPSA